MSATRSAGPRPQRSRALGVATTVAALIAIPAFALQAAEFVLDRRSDTPPSPPAATSTTPAAQPTPSSSSPSTRMLPTVGACLSGGRATACDDEHDAEIVGAAAACDEAAIYGYLGGSPRSDVLRRDIVPATRHIDGQAVCLIQVGEPTVGSAKNVLKGQEHSAWRWCLDTKDRQLDVSCTKPHDAEIVSREASASTSCQQAAAAYIGATWASLDRDVSARAFRSGDVRGCLVEARGRRVLTASVRGLGATALPLSG